MQTKCLVVMFGVALLAAGCVKTVSDTNKPVVYPALALFKDKFESRYERPVDQVYAAALEVIKANGTISRDSIINPGPNQVKCLEAKVGDRYVYVRVEAVDPKITSVKVQVRTKLGGTDLTLTQQLQGQIGIKLASQ
jgi:hypothetical protein